MLLLNYSLFYEILIYMGLFLNNFIFLLYIYIYSFLLQKNIFYIIFQKLMSKV